MWGGVERAFSGDVSRVVLVGMSTFGTVLIIWASVLAVLVVALALGTSRRRNRTGDGVDRRALPDRRRPLDDRRVGLPDLRPDRVERRSGMHDRRGGPSDRRRSLGAMGATLRRTG